MHTKKHHFIYKNTILLATSMICLILFFFLQQYIFNNNLEQIQLSVHQFFQNLQSPLLNNIIILITYSGNTIPILILTLLGSFLLFKFKFKVEGYFLTLNLLVLAISNHFIKTFFQRERPNFGTLIEQGGFSFPSGHAMINFGMGLIISYLAFKVLEYKKPATIITCVIMFYVTLIGISRMYVGVHYFSDVIGGWLMGTSVTCIMITLYEWLHEKYLDKDNLYYKRKI